MDLPLPIDVLTKVMSRLLNNPPIRFDEEICMEIDKLFSELGSLAVLGDTWPIFVVIVAVILLSVRKGKKE
jgi:hypothetical protein